MKEDMVPAGLIVSYFCGMSGGIYVAEVIDKGKANIPLLIIFGLFFILFMLMVFSIYSSYKPKIEIKKINWKDRLKVN